MTWGWFGVAASLCLMAACGMGLADQVSGAILVYCGSRRTLAVPVGWFRYRCSRCGLIFKGSE